MNKTVHTSERLGEQYTEFKHPTGLTVLLYPMPGYSSATALFGTHYGSVDRIFKSSEDADFVTVPDGIAHYLEHKLFESEDGDAFNLFAETGASANAYTSFDRTAYYFSCTDNFEASLRVLLKFVQSPYFTDETVQKEQGIIGQEIRMYDDDPGWQVLFNCLGGLYHNHPVKIDVAGTVESIAQINKELLYRCYHTFYNLNNMFLCIAGNFDSGRALEIIDDTLKDIPPLTIERGTVDEPDSIAAARSDVAMSVSQPQFCIGYKLPPMQGIEQLHAEMADNLLCELLVGEGSPLYKTLYDTALVPAGEVATEVFNGPGYYSVLFEGESVDPDKVLALLQQEIVRLQQDGLDPQAFSLAQKTMYGRLVAAFNSVDAVGNNLFSCALNGVKLYDPMDAAAALTLEQTQARLSLWTPDKCCLSIVRPLEGETA